MQVGYGDKNTKALPKPLEKGLKFIALILHGSAEYWSYSQEGAQICASASAVVKTPRG